MAKYPIIEIPRSRGENVLLEYKLTAEETRLFSEIDEATCNLPPEAPLGQFHDIAATVGAANGLNYRQSVAFFTRTILSMFETE